MPLRVPESFSTAETLPIASTAIVTMTATHAKAFPVMRSPPFLDTSLLTWVNPKNLLIALRRGRGARWNNNREQATTPGCANRSEEHTSELQSPCNLVCRLLLEKKNTMAEVVTCNG